MVRRPRLRKEEVEKTQILIENEKFIKRASAGGSQSKGTRKNQGHQERLISYGAPRLLTKKRVSNNKGDEWGGTEASAGDRLKNPHKTNVTSS